MNKEQVELIEKIMKHVLPQDEGFVLFLPGSKEGYMQILSNMPEESVVSIMETYLAKFYEKATVQLQ